MLQVGETMLDRLRQNQGPLALAGGLLLALEGAALYFQRIDHLHGFIAAALIQGAIYLAGVWIILAKPLPSGALRLVLIVAALLRIGPLLMPPYLSDDVYRYVWDGRVQAAGINPYRFVPESAALESLRDADVYPKINRRGYARTIYPPLAQAIFFAATRASESITWMKLVMVGFEVLATLFLVRLLQVNGLSGERVLIYAWNPLAIWEFAGSGHIDAAAIALLVVALWARNRNSPLLTGAALGCATLIKFYPAVLLPALYRRWDWKMPVAFATSIVLGYLPLVKLGRGALGFLPEYLKEEGILSGMRFYPWRVMQQWWPNSRIDGAVYLALIGALLLGTAVWMTLRQKPGDSFFERATLLAALATVLFSPHYAWYFAWLVPMLTFTPHGPLLYLTVAAFVLYHTRAVETLDSSFAANTVLYLPFAVVFIGHWLRKRLNVRPAI